MCCMSVACLACYACFFFFFFKQKTAYEMRISDWSSDVCSSDLLDSHVAFVRPRVEVPAGPPLAPPGAPSIAAPPAPPPAEPPPILDAEPRVVAPAAAHPAPGLPQPLAAARPAPLDPTGGVKGTSGTIRVELGGRRANTKKKK